MSSAEVYGAGEPGPNGFLESKLVSPISPYGASKAASEILVRQYGNKGGMVTNVIRSCNVYGPKQFPDKLIPKSISLLQNGQKVTIHGNGADIKRWVYVTDCSNAFNTIFHCGRPNATYNLGSHQAASNYNLCSTIIRSVVSRSKGQPSSSITVEDYMNKIPGRSCRDAGIGMDFTALKDLGWKQRFSMEEGIGRTVQWYEAKASNWWVI